MDLATMTFQGGHHMSTLARETSSRGGVSSRSSRRGVTMACAYLPHNGRNASGDYHAILGVSRFATKQEIKTSYRRLVRELHPDVCRGDHCSARFQQVQRAYEALIEQTTSQFGEFEDDLSDNLEGFMGVGDNWEDWEEWMGWEGAGTYDYSNHINPNLD